VRFVTDPFIPVYCMTGLQPAYPLAPAGADGGDRNGYLPRCCITQPADMGYWASLNVM